MRDAIITYQDGKRVAVSDLPIDEVLRLQCIAPRMENTGASDRTNEQLQERLRIEIVIRQRRFNSLL